MNVCMYVYHLGGDNDEQTGVLVDEEKLHELDDPVDGVDAVDEASGDVKVLRRKQAQDESEQQRGDEEHVERVHYLREEYLHFAGEARRVGLQQLAHLVHAVREHVDEHEHFGYLVFFQANKISE